MSLLLGRRRDRTTGRSKASGPNDRGPLPAWPSSGVETRGSGGTRIVCDAGVAGGVSPGAGGGDEPVDGTGCAYMKPVGVRTERAPRTREPTPNVVFSPGVLDS